MTEANFKVAYTMLYKEMHPALNAAMVRKNVSCCVEMVIHDRILSSWDEALLSIYPPWHRHGEERGE